MPQSVYRYIFNNSLKQQILVVILTLCLLPLAPVPLELQRRVLDDAIAQKNTDLLMELALYYLLALLLASGLKTWMKVQRGFISARIVHSLRASVYYCIYTVVPPSKLLPKENIEDQVDEGAVVSMLSSEVEKLGGFSGSAISGPLLQAGTLISILGYMFWVEPQVAAIALVLYSPQFFIVPYFQKRLNQLSRDKALKTRELGAFIVDNAEEDLLSKEPPSTFLSLTDQILNIRKRFLISKNVMKTIVNLLIALGPFGVIGFGGWLVIEGRLELGVILAFVSGLERLGGPIRELIAEYSHITEAQMRYRMLLATFPGHAVEEKGAGAFSRVLKG